MYYTCVHTFLHLCHDDFSVPCHYTTYVLHYSKIDTQWCDQNLLIFSARTLIRPFTQFTGLRLIINTLRCVPFVNCMWLYCCRLILISLFQQFLLINDAFLELSDLPSLRQIHWWKDGISWRSSNFKILRKSSWCRAKKKKSSSIDHDEQKSGFELKEWNVIFGSCGNIITYSLQLVQITVYITDVLRCARLRVASLHIVEGLSRVLVNGW